MESFHWDKHFETGLETVDYQHHTLVDLINRIGELLTQADNVPFEDIEAVFIELIAYTQYHFHEEKHDVTSGARSSLSQDAQTAPRRFYIRK
jgi:hemerythrin